MLFTCEVRRVELVTVRELQFRTVFGSLLILFLPFQELGVKPSIGLVELLLSVGRNPLGDCRVLVWSYWLEIVNHLYDLHLFHLHPVLVIYRLLLFVVIVLLLLGLYCWFSCLDLMLVLLLTVIGIRLKSMWGTRLCGTRLLNIVATNNLVLLLLLYSSDIILQNSYSLPIEVGLVAQLQQQLINVLTLFDNDVLHRHTDMIETSIELVLCVTHLVDLAADLLVSSC